MSDNLKHSNELIFSVWNAWSRLCHLSRSPQDWKFRQTSETDCLWNLAPKSRTFSVFKPTKKNPKPQNKKTTAAFMQSYHPAWSIAAVSGLDTADASGETFLLLPNPPVNFQYLMSWWALAASGNPQWCDWWISQYSDLFSSKLTGMPAWLNWSYKTVTGCSLVL